jgi:hypothetical protein
MPQFSRARTTVVLSFALLAVTALLPTTAASAPGTTLAADSTDVVRGRILGPDSQAVANALVTITTTAGKRKATRSDARGHFIIVAPDKSGDYELVVMVIGLMRYQQHIAANKDSSTNVGDIYLQRSSRRLSEINTIAYKRSAPQQGFNREKENVGKDDEWIGRDDLSGALNDVVSRLAGIEQTAQGFSVMGMDVSQNNITINGSPIAGDLVPQDAMMGGRVITNTYDMSRGGFSGGQLAFVSIPGQPFLSGNVRFGFEHPSLQWSDPVAARFGQRYQNLQASGSISTPIGDISHKLSTMIAYQFGRRSSDLQSLLGADPSALERLGVSGDSLDRFLALVSEDQIPTTAPGAPNSNQRDNRSASMRLDHNDAWRDPHAQYFMAVLGQSIQDAASLDLRSLPAHAGESRNSSMLFQFGLRDNINDVFLNHFVVSVSALKTRTSPYVSLPDGRVFVASALTDGTGSITSLSFGGNSQVGDESTNSVAEFRNETSWQTLERTHLFKITFGATINRLTQQRNANRLGTYTYSSLEDLEANSPSSFTRTLFAPSRTTSTVTGATSFGDFWRVTQRLQLLYGVRLETTRFGQVPSYNPTVDSVFGRRTDQRAGEARLSPGVGFTWNYGHGKRSAPRGSLKGGIREYRGVMSPLPLDATGLPDAIRQITCVGSAVPVPDWEAFAADPSMIPSECVGGSSDPIFSITQPNVTLVDRRYQAPRRIAGGLGWSAKIFNIPISISGDYSRGTAQESYVDLNFVNTPKLSLAEEGGRPIFVSTASIVEQTGTVASRESRYSTLFGQVLNRQSDLHSIGRQFTVAINQGSGSWRPVSIFGLPISGSVAYLHSNVSTQARGFNGTTSGDPTLIEWGRNTQPTHTITVSGNIGKTWGNWGRKPHPWGTLQVNFRLLSGMHYTPLVSSDINGDGAINDRAFVFDPTQAADAAFATSMQSLLASAPERASKCLVRQLGRVAGRNSCEGPWSATMDMVYKPTLFGLSRNPSLTIALQNPLGGIDQLLHGNDDLRGWGQPGIPDPLLLKVKGFDPNAQRFVYDVNPRFGEARRNAFYLPFTLRIQASYRFHRVDDRQWTIRMFGYDPEGHDSLPGVKTVATRLRRTWGGGADRNLFQQAINQRDTILLLDEQITRLVALNRQYEEEMDGLTLTVAERFVESHGRISSIELREMMGINDGASDERMIRTARWGKLLREVLTPEQWDLLPEWMIMWVDAAITYSENQAREQGQPGSSPRQPR